MTMLAGRCGIVTGATSGLGRAISLRLAAEGASLVLADLRDVPAWAPEGPLPTARLIERGGGSARFVQADVSQPSEVSALFVLALEHFGRVDLLVNNAGRFGSSSVLETSDEEWDDYLSVNLRSQFLMCRAAVAQMLAQPLRDGVRGRIVNIASQLGVTAPPGHAAYAVSKAGVAQLTRQLAVDYGRRGVIVNAVSPGRIITGTHPGEQAYLAAGTVDEATAYSLSRTPFSRLGRPEDVAGAVLFLCSDDCSFVSGHNLMVDGGWTAY